MSERYEHVDVVVVGGGLAGLAAGATVAAGGASAVVVEAHQPGGRARTVTREGFVFNLGAHALYRGGPGFSMLGSLGVHPTGAPPPLRRYRLLIGDELHAMPVGLQSLVATTALGARSKAQLGRVLAGLPRLCPGRLGDRSAGSWLADLGLRSDAGSVLRAVCRLTSYVGDLDEVSADVVVAQLQLGTRSGVLYLHGGWAQLTDALGVLVEVRTACAVGTVELAAGHIEVHTSTGVLVAKAVIVAPGTPSAARKVLPDASWGQLGPAVTASCLDVGVARVARPGYVIGVDEPLYATTQSPPADQAPPGCAVVEVLRYGTRSAAEDRPALEAHLRHAGVGPGDVVTSRFLAAMTVAGVLPEPATGGLAGRPGITDSGLPGVFLAGDWIGPDGWLADASLASAHDAGVAALDWIERHGSNRRAGRSIVSRTECSAHQPGRPR